MFKLWKLKSARRRALAHVEQTKNAAVNNPEDHTRAKRFIAALADVPMTATRIEWFIGDRLYDEALALDIQIPDFKEPGMWEPLIDGKEPVLTSKGRFHLRKLIDEEKAHRFKIRTLWVTNIILPLLAALIGAVGAITGLVAVLRHTK